MKMLVMAAVAMMLSGGLADETKLGAGVTLSQPTAIADVVKSPADFVGKTIRVDGVATAVCEEMGCWLAVSESDKAGAPTVRLKVEHDGAIVFPMSAKGKQVSAQGTFEAIGGNDEHGASAASEHASQDPKASKDYQIKATGALIK
jgi:hypothetical protein